jgi:hypothetical protein
MYVETNVSGSTPFKLVLSNGTTFTMSTGTDFKYLTLNNLNSGWYTFYITDSSNALLLNWTKPSLIHKANQNRTDEKKYVSFNGTSYTFNNTQFYIRPNPMINTSAFRYCQDAPGGNLYDCMSVQYWGTYGVSQIMGGSSYDRGETFRGGVWNGEIYDTGMLNFNLPLNRPRSYIVPSYSATNSTETRFCYAFTDSFINESIYPANNITQYCVQFWQEIDHWSDYLGITQDVEWDYAGLFQWRYDTLAGTRDWLAQANTKNTTYELLLEVDKSVFGSVYDQRLVRSCKSGFEFDAKGYNAYEIGFQTDGQWNNIMTGKYQAAILRVNDDVASMAVLDTDGDGLSDYDEWYTYHTDPKRIDTDEGGSSDYAEVMAGLNPLLYTDDETIPPGITIVYPTYGGVYKDYTGAINITINETGGNCSINNTNWIFNNGNTTHFNFMYSGIPDGSYYLNISCWDRLLNNASTLTHFTTDKTSPAIDFVLPTTTAGMHAQNYIDANVTASDNVLGVDYITIRLYNSTEQIDYYTLYSSQAYKRFNSLDDGTYYINATSCDLISNCNSTETREIILASSGPTITIESPLAQVYTENNTWFNVTTTGVSCWFNLNSGNNITLENDTLTHYYNYTENLANGNYLATFYCNDSLGTINSADVTFGIDTIPPSITLHYPLTTTYISTNNIRFNYTPSSDIFNLDTCQLYGNWSGIWSIKNSTNTPIKDAVNNLSSIVPEGTHKWNILCNDSNGIGDWSQQGNQTFIVDTSAPKIKVINPTNGATYYTSTIWFNASANEVISDWIINYNGTNISIPINTSRELANGTYNLFIYAQDLAGNWGLNSSVTFSVNLYPAISFNVPTTSSGSYNQTWITWNITGEYGGGLSRIEFERYKLIGGNLLLDYSWINNSGSGAILMNHYENNTGLSYGTYYINATATSLSGNKGKTETRIIELTETPSILNGQIAFVPYETYSTSLWMVDFGLSGSSSVSSYNEALCGSLPGGPTSYVTASRLGTYALNYNAQSSSIGNTEKQRFSIINWPKRPFSNSFRVFFELNTTVTSGLSVGINLNLSKVINQTGLLNGYNSSTLRIYRINRNGGIYNDSDLCLETGVIAG